MARRRVPSRPVSRLRAPLVAALLAASTALALTCEPVGDVGRQTFASPQVDPIAVSSDGSRVYVANTTSDSVSVIDTATLAVVAEIPVGVEPVSLALRPNGAELWVSNHVSDSVSVIDLDPASPTLHAVVRTVQELDADGRTLFDEPVGIAFADDTKAYVALSSRNDIAVVDTASYAVTGRIHITAQEPRAIAVRGGSLYVIPFESGNRSALSVCPQETVMSAPDCTLLAREVGDFVVEPNLPGRDKNIVIDPLAPDRDLFVIDTATDQVVETVSTIGTLLYGLAVSGTGEVFITQTDARNADNGLEGENLIDLENRIFDNQIARVACGGGSCGAPSHIDLEPPLPAQPAPGQALATPYGVALSGDDATLVATAAGTSRLFTVDTATGQVLDVLDLGPPAGQQIPRGVALVSDASGAPATAYVLNTLQNQVSVVDVSDPTDLQPVAKLPVGSDPTPLRVRLGRIAFNDAFASDSNTFACASCHPDGNTDQLLWRIGGACFFGDCSGDDEVRSTMPVRGLTATIPLHWDGTLGDPFGGTNGAFGPGAPQAPNCTDEHDCFRHLVDASLAGVMCDQAGGCDPGPAGLAGPLGDFARENMAVFLASVSYPPARERSMADALSASARQGLSDFFVDHGGVGNVGGVTTCGDMNSGCHSLPLMASSSSPTLQGFDAPTLRGLNDRHLLFSLGMPSSRRSLEGAQLQGATIPFGGIELQVPHPPEFPWSVADGFEEDAAFGASFAAFSGIYGVGPAGIFQMLQEMSTGHSGAFARQVTLDAQTAGLAETADLLDVLEAADADGLVNLRAEGVRIGAGGSTPVTFSYRADTGQWTPEVGLPITRAGLLQRTGNGSLVVTVTAALPPNYGAEDHPQPLLLPAVDGGGAIGNPAIPLLPSENPMALRARRLRDGAQVLVDGRPAQATITCTSGLYDPFCAGEDVTLTLASPPATTGMHTVQVQNPQGPTSNELPVCVGSGRPDCL